MGDSTNYFQTIEGQSQLLRDVGSLDSFFADVVEAVEFAAEAIVQDVSVRGFRSIQSKAESKSDGSPVSSADQASHDVLVQRLTACSPFPIVSEEDPRGVPNLESVNGSPFFWLADPLDGTRDFLAGEKSFAVSLALMRVSPEGVRPYFGCICDPTEQTTWWGSRETQLVKRVQGEEVAGGAASGDKRGRKVNDVGSVSSEVSSEAPLRVLGSRSIPSERMNDLYKFWNVTEVTRLGSALKFALIAEGSFDVYPRFGPTSEWDTAAGQVLLEITGGGLISLKTGLPMAYGKPEWRNEGFVAMRTEAMIETWLPKIRSAVRA